MQDIDHITLIDLLPPNLKYNTHSVAFSAALRAAFDVVLKDCQDVLLYPVIEQLQHAPLDKLALQWGVQGYKDSLPLDNKRKLVKHGLVAKLYAGTAWVVKDKISDAFSDDALIREWYEYGGDPYLFGIDIETSNGMDTRRLADVESLISDVKNARSHLDYLRITLTHGGPLYLGGATMTGGEITIEPYTVKNIDSDAGITLYGWAKSWQAIVIEPQTDKEIILEAGITAALELTTRQTITLG